MTIDSNMMQQIVTNVFGEMFGLTIEHLEPSATTFAQDRIVASVNITGETEQFIVVEAPCESATFIAETMFAAASGTLDDSDVLDAVGEIANMIGGNVKGIYDCESKLSIPAVSETSARSKCNDMSQYATKVSGHPILICWQDLLHDVHTTSRS